MRINDGQCPGCQSKSDGWQPEGGHLLLLHHHPRGGEDVDSQGANLIDSFIYKLQLQNLHIMTPRSWSAVALGGWPTTIKTPGMSSVRNFHRNIGHFNQQHHHQLCQKILTIPGMSLSSHQLSHSYHLQHSNIAVDEINSVISKHIFDCSEKQCLSLQSW